MKVAIKSAPHIDGELNVREIQLASLRILKVIDKVCETEGMWCWLMYGSLLGTVRRHGFIPWDDDLDIAMPRPVYERFAAYFQANRECFYPLVALRGDGNRNLPFMITRISDARFRTVGEYGDEAPELGAFIDVYPMDGSGETVEDFLNLKNDCLKLLRAFQNAANFPTSQEGCGFLRRCFRAVRAPLLGDPDGWVTELTARATSRDYESSNYISCLVLPFDTGRPYVGKRDLFCTKRCRFEDIDAPIPVGYETALSDLRGDYIQLSPEEQRVGHHYYSLVKRVDCDAYC